LAVTPTAPFWVIEEKSSSMEHESFQRPVGVVEVISRRRVIAVTVCSIGETTKNVVAKIYSWRYAWAEEKGDL
jgi:hypothetical protein